MEIVHARVLGEGPDLIILHGYFGMGDNWKTLANKFATDFKVHLIDQRNHGRSFHSEEFDYELLSQDVLNYMQANTIQKANFIGHSMGGKTVMTFATEHEERTNSIIVADIGPKNYPPHHHEILEALNSVDFEMQKTRSDIESQLSVLIKEPGVRQFLMKNVYRETKDKLGYRCNVSALTEHNNEVGAPLATFTSFDGPTLFLKGENSGYISDVDFPLIEAHFPNFDFTEISKAGHWLHAENPKEFLEACYSFWETKEII